jgi:hypothetical protein
VSLQLSLLFPHSELVWPLAVRYQGDPTSHNKTELYVVILPIKGSTTSQKDFHCFIALQDEFRAHFAIK